MEQLSEPAVLLARHTYFPDMLLVRLLSLRVPCLSSAKQAHSYTFFTIIYCIYDLYWSSGTTVTKETIYRTLNIMPLWELLGAVKLAQIY